MDDLISREQAIDALREKLAEYVPYLYSRKVEEIPLECEMTIRNLPSAESEIIRCKDCKYFARYTDDGTFESVLKMHQWDGECSEWVGHTYMGWFCSRAERRTDEADYRKE